MTETAAIPRLCAICGGELGDVSLASGGIVGHPRCIAGDINPSPAPAVGELVETLNSYATDHGGYFETRNVSVPKQLITNAAARISQLEAENEEFRESLAGIDNNTQWVVTAKECFAALERIGNIARALLK